MSTIILVDYSGYHEKHVYHEIPNYYLNLFQSCVQLKGVSGLLVAQTLLKGELKYAQEGGGVQCVMTSGDPWMLKWSVDN